MVDISVPNPNVFYELGLAYGANQKIIVLRQAASQFGKDIADHLNDGGCKTYAYHDLNPLLPRDFPLSQYVWRQRPIVLGAGDSHPSILLLERYKGPIQSPKREEDTVLMKEVKDIHLDLRTHVMAAVGLAQDTASMREVRDICLDFRTHVMAAVGVAIDNVLKRISTSDKDKLLRIYEEDVKRMRTADVIKDSERFSETIQRVQKAFCMIIRTGPGCDPMSYFWLGYCHALGKNVIPVTVLDTAGQTIDDLAFDIRALWHMTFLRDRSDTFAPEIEEILYQMIVSDFSEWSRRGFWDEMLTRRGKVSIFAGALHNEPIGREMIGDWDLRAVSELTSFFAIHQYRAVIESPVYQIEFVLQQGAANREDYLSGLEKMLENKNCVVIASPDVNPLTELVLGRIYGIPPKFWFTTDDFPQKPPHVVVALKEKEKPKDENKGEPAVSEAQRRFFYTEKTAETGGRLHRGFCSSMLRMHEVMGEFVSQTEPPAEFTVHAHLVIAPNPFRSGPESHEPKYIIVLNGVSGPATFALTSALTGGAGTKEFEPHAKDFDRESESESILQKILKQLDTARHSGRAGFQCILSVTVGPCAQRGQSAFAGIREHI